MHQFHMNERSYSNTVCFRTSNMIWSCIFKASNLLPLLELGTEPGLLAFCDNHSLSTIPSFTSIILSESATHGYEETPKVSKIKCSTTMSCRLTVGLVGLKSGLKTFSVLTWICLRFSGICTWTCLRHWSP